VRALGAERARSFLEARPLPPPLDLRARVDRDELARVLREARPEGELELGLAEHALHARRVGDPRELPGYAEGRFVVQEQGAQLLGSLVGAQPGEHVLDACAGHGGKTLQLVEAVGPTGRVVATDLHEARLDRGTEERARLGLADAPVESIAIDWTVGDGGLGEDPDVAARGGFDRVLVDAPCTGLGTIHRRPELPLRAKWEDVVALAKIQRAILERVAPLVRPGGLLVYAVCSPLAEEGPAIARALTEANPELEPTPLAIAGARSDDDGVLRLGPWFDGCDAYQVAAWRRLGWSASPTSGE
jgi:16S rRNA (cytosine967-C5)-methyltransferase